MEKKEWLKLSSLSGEEIIIKKVVKKFYRMWDVGSNKYITQDSPGKGFSKMYVVEIDKGMLSISGSQYGAMLEGCADVRIKGVADVNNAKFRVATNNKQGMEIRYYFNFQGYDEDVIQIPEDGEMNSEDIPF